ncbi:hypothetical protein [Ruegeria arenilitoris]|uniref:hypothetical protein n=1 Tax=Ruegeria arenilitoris TaxID=1173585 RepID=UPI0020C3FC86|nr:hypothetical protein [Ruegeria arenilitoris]
MLARIFACPQRKVSPRAVVEPWYGIARKLAAVATFLTFVLAAPAPARAQGPMIVGSDRGGYLHDRLIELENLQRHGIQVEIRGRVCFSTCTMFLGLPGTCVNPDTTFGFHGPSRSGRRLAPADFDYFSEVMASYYPEPLRTWFMDKGRNRINGVYKIKGTELIRLGIPSCQTA